VIAGDDVARPAALVLLKMTSVKAMSDPAAKYEALRLLLTSSGAPPGEQFDLTSVLEAVCHAIGLSGAGAVLDVTESKLSAIAGTEWAQEAIRRFASDLIAQLLRDHQVESAFLQLSPGDKPLSLFCYPLRADGWVSGVVIGLTEGRRNLALEDDFLLALVTAMSLALQKPERAPAPAGSETDAIEKARIAAVLETAIAVNHEVNNPLTAVLGNTQLLLLQADRLDPQTLKRLQAIEESALRIKDVTQKLLRQGKIRTTEYPGGLRMLDLSGTDDESPNQA
jgi:signal transduction histidine kinase